MLLVFVLGGCFFWNLENISFEIDGVKSNENPTHVVMDPSETVEIIITFNLQCRTRRARDFNRDSYSKAKICFEVADYSLWFYSRNNLIMSNCDRKGDCKGVPKVITDRQELLAGEMKLILTAGPQIPPGTHTNELVFDERPKDDKLAMFTRGSFRLLKVTVPYGTFITPKTIVEFGVFKLKFEPHPQAKFRRVEFYEDTDPNSDDNDQLLASPTNPPFEVDVNFTENGIRTFYAKAFEETLSNPIISNKQDVKTNN